MMREVEREAQVGDERGRDYQIRLGPQSEQSVPYGHSLNSEPGPPSLHRPFEVHEHSTASSSQTCGGGGAGDGMLGGRGGANGAPMGYTTR